MPKMSNAVRKRAVREVNLEPIASAPGEPRRLLVPLKASGSRPPLFVVPGQFGEAFQFTRLAGRLREDIPFHSFEARGLWGDVEPHQTIEEAAADYISEMRSVQPHGPYYLAGFSLGGMTAWEMVHQLSDAGERVRLMIFDVGPEVLVRRAERRRRERKNVWQRVTHPLRVLTFHARNAIGLHGARRKAYLRSTIRQEARRFGRRIGLGRDNFLYRMTLSAGRRPPPGHHAVRNSLRGARDGWTWKPYAERFTLLRARIQSPGRGIGPTLGFTPEIAAGGMDIRHVPGHHGFIFTEPHVFTVIAEIEDWIDRIEAEGARPTMPTEATGAAVRPS